MTRNARDGPARVRQEPAALRARSDTAVEAVLADHHRRASLHVLMGEEHEHLEELVVQVSVTDHRVAARVGPADTLAGRRVVVLQVVRDPGSTAVAVHPALPLHVRVRWWVVPIHERRRGLSVDVLGDEALEQDARVRVGAGRHERVEVRVRRKRHVLPVHGLEGALLVVPVLDDGLVRAAGVVVVIGRVEVRVLDPEAEVHAQRAGVRNLSAELGSGAAERVGAVVDHGVAHPGVEARGQPRVRVRRPAALRGVAVRDVAAAEVREARVREGEHAREVVSAEDLVLVARRALHRHPLVRLVPRAAVPLVGRVARVHLPPEVEHLPAGVAHVVLVPAEGAGHRADEVGAAHWMDEAVGVRFPRAPGIPGDGSEVRRVIALVVEAVVEADLAVGEVIANEDVVHVLVPDARGLPVGHDQVADHLVVHLGAGLEPDVLVRRGHHDVPLEAGVLRRVEADAPPEGVSDQAAFDEGAGDVAGQVEVHRVARRAVLLAEPAQVDVAHDGLGVPQGDGVPTELRRRGGLVADDAEAPLQERDFSAFVEVPRVALRVGLRDDLAPVVVEEVLREFQAVATVRDLRDRPNRVIPPVEAGGHDHDLVSHLPVDLLFEPQLPGGSAGMLREARPGLVRIAVDGQLAASHDGQHLVADGAEVLASDVEPHLVGRLEDAVRPPGLVVVQLPLHHEQILAEIGVEVAVVLREDLPLDGAAVLADEVVDALRNHLHVRLAGRFVAVPVDLRLRVGPVAAVALQVLHLEGAIRVPVAGEHVRVGHARVGRQADADPMAGAEGLVGGAHLEAHGRGKLVGRARPGPRDAQAVVGVVEAAALAGGLLLDLAVHHGEAVQHDLAGDAVVHGRGFRAGEQLADDEDLLRVEADVFLGGGHVAQRAGNGIEAAIAAHGVAEGIQLPGPDQASENLQHADGRGAVVEDPRLVLGHVQLLHGASHRHASRGRGEQLHLVVGAVAVPDAGGVGVVAALPHGAVAGGEVPGARARPAEAAVRHRVAHGGLQLQALAGQRQEDAALLGGPRVQLLAVPDLLHGVPRLVVVVRVAPAHAHVIHAAAIRRRHVGRPAPPVADGCVLVGLQRAEARLVVEHGIQALLAGRVAGAAVPWAVAGEAGTPGEGQERKKQHGRRAWRLAAGALVEVESTGSSKSATTAGWRTSWRAPCGGLALLFPLDSHAKNWERVWRFRGNP
eukprot:scaffold225_cov235-Pinguiococcus_pyrenoidosus.AAC.6